MSNSQQRQHSGASTQSSASTQQQFALNRPPYPDYIPQSGTLLNNNPFIQPQQRNNQLNIPSNMLFRSDNALNTSDDEVGSNANSPMPTQYSTATHTPNNMDLNNATVTSGKRVRGRSMNVDVMDDSPELNGAGPYNSLKLRRKLRKNTREKQRRTELNDQFDQLCDMLHLNTGHGKVEKFTVLTEAINVIDKLTRQLQHMKQERYELRNELSKLSTVLQQSATPAAQADIQALQQIQQRYFPPSPHTDVSRTTSQSTTPVTQYLSYSQQPYSNAAYNQPQAPLQVNTVMPDSFATMSVSTPTRTTPVQAAQPVEPVSPSYTYNSAPAPASPNRVSPHSALYQQTTPHSVMPAHHRTLSRSSSGHAFASTQQYPPVPATNTITFPQYQRPASTTVEPTVPAKQTSDASVKTDAGAQPYQQFSPSQLTMVSPTSNQRTFNFAQPGAANPQQPVFQYSRHRRGTGSFGSGFAFGSGSFNFNFTANNSSAFQPPVSSTPALDTLPTLDELTRSDQENSSANVDTAAAAAKQAPTHQRRPSFSNYSHNRNLSLGLFNTHQRLPSLSTMMNDTLTSPPFASTPLIPPVQEEDIATL